MTTYSTWASAKTLGGTYIDENVPDTMNLDTDYYMTNAYNEINFWLDQVGVTVPVDTTTFTVAAQRLKELQDLRVLAQAEKAIGVSSNPQMGSKEDQGHTWQEDFERKLGIPEKYNDKEPIYRGYLNNPRSLFRGQSGLSESDIDDAFNSSRELQRPISSQNFSYTAEYFDFDNDQVFTRDKQF